MAGTGQGYRDSSDDATVVNRQLSASLNNPLQTPKKAEANSEKKGALVKDEEGQVRIDEASLSEASIKVKQLSWQEAAGLMCTEYIVIAILSFPSSYSALGMAGGVITTIIVGLTVLYTSHVLWRYCMAHPESTDIIDLSARLFPPKYRKIVYPIVATAFLLNNLFIAGLHVLAGSVALNVLSDHAVCTVIFSVVMVVVMFFLSLARELNQVAIMGIVAASTMFIAFLLCLIFLGIEGHPAGWTPGASVTVRTWAAPGTTFVTGFNAFLNITYTFVGQILIPSYVDDMKKPEDFPKALYLVTFFELIVFTLGGAIGYHYIGDEAMTSPAYGSLRSKYAKIVAGFTLPTLLVVGILYSNVTSRFVFLRIFDVNSKHRLQHTVKGWSVWIAIVLGWIVAFVIGEGIPFFNELLSLMSSIFDWWFGFVLEAIAFFRLYNQQERASSKLRKLETALNVVIFIAGLFILGGGAYSSISAIADSFAAGTVAGAFSCEDNSPVAAG